MSISTAGASRYSRSGREQILWGVAGLAIGLSALLWVLSHPPEVDVVPSRVRALDERLHAALPGLAFSTSYREPSTVLVRLDFGCLSLGDEPRRKAVADRVFPAIESALSGPRAESGLSLDAQQAELVFHCRFLFFNANRIETRALKRR